MKLSFPFSTVRPGIGALLGFLAAMPLGAQNAGSVDVRMVRPQRGEIFRYVTLPGTFRADQQATLYPKVAGYLKSVSVDKGDRVKAGQVLAEIEVPELVAERGRYRAEVEVARLAAQRLTAAQAKSPDLIVPAAVDEAKARLQIAQANLERVETLLNYGKITAPFAGIVTMRFADPGAFVAAPSAGGTAQNAALFTLMDIDTVRLQVAVPEIEAVRVRPGQPVQVSLEELPGKTFSGRVSRLGFALDEASRTMLVEADFKNPGGEFRPGMYAKARLGVERHAEALLLPVDAIVMEKAAASAFIVADGKAQKLALTVGFNDGQQVEVITGLNADQSVILVGKLSLAPGQAVRATEAK